MPKGPLWRFGESRQLAAAQKGDREAFDALMHRHTPELCRFVSARSQSKDVDDLMQEIWLGAWKAMPSFDGRSRFRTWLLAIAMHKIWDHYRARNRHPSEMNLEAAADVPDRPSMEHRSLEASQSVQALLECLPESQAEVIRLYYGHELTLAEVAQILNRNLNTVKYQFCQAHNRMAGLARQEELL